MMKSSATIVGLALLGLATVQAQGGGMGQAPAGPPPAVSAEALTLWNRTWNNLVAAADKMTEADYAFKPFPESMSFGQLVAHSADSAMGACSAFNGERKQLGAAQMTTKAALAEALKTAGAECQKAYGALTDDTLGQAAQGGFGVRTRAGVLFGNTIHMEHEYAQMAVHLRLKGIVPPSSDRSGRPGGAGQPGGQGRGRGM